jgi:hypothetical protein
MGPVKDRGKAVAPTQEPLNTAMGWIHLSDCGVRGRCVAVDTAVSTERTLIVARAIFLGHRMQGRQGSVIDFGFNRDRNIMYFINDG